MDHPKTLNTEAIIILERRDEKRFRHLSLEERGELLASACRTAAAIEESRRQMGFPPSRPAPWPESTWKFLAECARRARGQQ